MAEISNLQADKDRISLLCDIEDGLSEWEVQFIESVAKRTALLPPLLTDKQREVADKILERYGI